jgi:antitoxin HigA-1
MRCGVETITSLLKTHGLPTHRPPTSPGEMVAHFLEDLGLSQAEVARALGLTANRLNEVVKGKRGISADTALRLAAYFGTTAQFWLNVQDAWDLWHELKRGSRTYLAIRQPQAVRAAAASCTGTCSTTSSS